jgi:hypothetical protein
LIENVAFGRSPIMQSYYENGGTQNVSYLNEILSRIDEASVKPRSMALLKSYHVGIYPLPPTRETQIRDFTDKKYPLPRTLNHA